MEQWKPVIGHEMSYEVSDLGRVRSVDRIVRRKIGKGLTPDRLISVAYPGSLLAPGLASNGYLTVSLNGISRCVHILVLTAFVGPAPAGNECCHNDGVRTNNNAVNLRWGTRTSNTRDRMIHGTQLRGEKYATAKLTDATAKRIKELRGALPQSELARMFNVSPSAVQAVHDGRTWKHA